jgi:hypothetical protein
VVAPGKNVLNQEESLYAERESSLEFERKVSNEKGNEGRVRVLRDGSWASESGLNRWTLGSHFLSYFSLTLSD